MPQTNEPPRQYLCPITGDMMTDPVIAEDGYTYERTAITRWLNENGTSPFTVEPLQVERLIPNRILQELIERYQQENPEDPMGANLETPEGPEFASPLVAPIKTHQEVMQKLTADLAIDFSAVYVGTAVEQAVVAMAGIYTDQRNAQFRRNDDGTTYFRLTIDSREDYQKLITYYQECYRCILAQEPASASGLTILPATVSITMDSNKLYHQVSPALGQYRKNSHQLLMEKLAQDLQVAFDEVYIGTVVEQQLVKLAGIDLSQEGATFRPNANLSTQFHLNFPNDADGPEKLTAFLRYYRSRFPGFILQARRDGTTPCVKIDVNAHILYEQVSPMLGACLLQQPAPALSM